ncbi:MAG: UbiA family prenyltransferase [Methylobacter sp.]
MKNWLVWLRLGRISNLPTVWSNVLAGTLLAGAQPDVNTGLVLLAASLLYEGGMLLNDAFDSAIDARERPQRPIPSGEIAVRSVFFVGFAMLATGVALMSVLGRPVLVLASLLALAIIAYNLHHKGVAWSPWLMGLCRALVYLMAGFAASAEPESRLTFAAGALLAYVAGLSYAAKQENLTRFRAGWPLALLAAPLLYGLVAIGWYAVPYLVLFGTWVVHCLLLLYQRHDTRRAVEGLIAGIALLDALFIADSGAPIGALGAVAAFGLCWFWQRWVAGT